MSHADRNNVRSSAGKKPPLLRRMSRWLDAGLYLRDGALGQARSSGALPPHLRSLPHRQTPAPGCCNKGPAALTAEPRAVRLASGRSGRTPAEPYPPKGNGRIPPTRPHRRAPEHPWRNSHRGKAGTSPSAANSGRQKGLTASPTGAILGTRVVPFWARALVPFHLRITRLAL